MVSEAQKYHQNELDNLLLEAVAQCHVKDVVMYLEKGANPNYTTFSDEAEPNKIIQPTTPLRMVLFRISDSLLDDFALQNCYEIAQILLQKGANALPAKQIADERYGKYDALAPKDLFQKIRTLIEQSVKS